MVGLLLFVRVPVCHMGAGFALGESDGVIVLFHGWNVCRGPSLAANQLAAEEPWPSSGTLVRLIQQARFALG